MAYRLGVDVGGTFTDLLLIDEASGETYRAKVPSTPEDSSIGVLGGIEKVCGSANVNPGDITHVMHGTTVATNTILEGKGARVGLVTTEGHRQVLQIARSFVPGILAGWIIWPKPEPLAPLEATIEAIERRDARGGLVKALEEDDLRGKLEGLKKRGIQALTVSLINAYANGETEARIREIAEEIMPDVPVSISSEVLPEMYEYERAITTVANSYVAPVVRDYLSNLSNEMKKREVNAHLHILRSDGGLSSVEASRNSPVNVLMSGPAGGVAGALWIAKQAGFKDLLTLDMGGTSTDVALIQDGIPRKRRETTVGDITVRASSLDVRTVGAGGGSIAHVPELTKALRVGPESAGANPGPASYGRGGDRPAVTDANVVLGYLPPELIGGEMKLDVPAATAAVQTIADALSLDLKTAAAGIIDIVNENIFGALRLVSVQQGFDPRDFALIAFGGAGPLHANALGKLMGAWPVIIPPSPGVLCAYGDATTRVTDEASRSVVRQFSEISQADVAKILGELEERAHTELDAEGVSRDEQSVEFEVDLRYHGQGLQLPVNFTGAEFEKEGLDLLRRKFDDMHTQLFTFALDAEHEIVTLRAIVQGKETFVAAATLPEGGEDPSEAVVATTQVYMDNREQDAKIYDRSKLKAGNRIVGPAIVTEMDSTTLILSDHAGDVDQFGTIIIRPTSA
ncbi:MAG: hydantoinase/oxoprolinase family protein [Rhodospirillaceae bacterium]|nr:hydantoinase/oxoprolinase family protein [Rhodospirillaceae bacterium]MBT7293244.1 hydantoinase/oxoprolinase family protein [Rhodospirillaceae bacterium]